MKKKITMLFAALLACAGVWAQTVLVNKPLDEIVASSITDTEKAVFIKNAGRVVDNSTDWYWKSLTENSQIDGVKTTDPDNNASKYLILEREEGVYDIYSLAEAKYVVTEATGNSANCVKLVDEVGTIQGWKIVNNDWAGKNDFDVTESNAYDLIPSSINLTEREDAGTQGTTPSANYNGGVLYNNLGTWNANDANSAWAFQQVVSAYTVTYNLKFLGETAKTITVEVVPGAEYPEIDLPYGITATKPEGNVNGNVDCDVECTLSGELPFQFATDYNSIEHWYYLNIRDDAPTYMYYDSSVDYIKATESSVPNDSKDAYTWAFVGNPFTGFSIVNYAAGETMVLSAPTDPTGDKNAAELARMVAKDGATGNLVWTILKPTHTDKNPAPVEGSFYVQHPTATTYAFNRQDYNSIKTVCYWSDRDTGSDLQVVERPMGAAAELAALVEEIEAMGVVGGENIGDYTVASVTALNEAVAAAKAVETATAEDVAALQAAIDGLAINLPEVGKFYAIKSASTKEYCSGKYVHSIPSPITRVDATWGPNAYDHRHLVFDEMVSIDATALWQFTEDMKMRNVHTGEYVKSFNKNVEHMGAEATASSITIKPLGSSQVSLQIGSDRPMHAQEAYFVIVDWDAELNNASAWYIEEVTEFAHPLTIDEYDYMTLTLGFNAEVPEGVTAYKVTGTEGKELTLESVGTVIPAGEPVIVYAEVAEGQTKDVEFAYTAEEATKSGDNLLKGTLVDNSAVAPTTGYDAYVMALNGTEVVMGKAILTEGQFKNRANKAYLELPTVQDAPAMFSFGRGEGTTGIETAVNGEQTVVIYDLAGRRVEKMEKGIYIVNGKKVIK